MIHASEAKRVKIANDETTELSHSPAFYSLLARGTGCLCKGNPAGKGLAAMESAFSV
jgi:hypothetical protein